LRNGETQILAGLISDEERSSANRLPGLGDLPLIGRLFGSQSDQHNKTEIILLVTPRVVRNIVPPNNVRSMISAGTESLVGAAPLSVKNSAPRSLSISASGGAPAGVAGPAPRALPEAPPEAAVADPVAGDSAPEAAALPVDRIIGGPPPVQSTESAPLLPGPGLGSPPSSTPGSATGVSPRQ
jgi:general secretion pathway protein D